MVDINRDGLIDIVFTQTNADPFYQDVTVQVLVQQSDGSFADQTSLYFNPDDFTAAAGGTQGWSAGVEFRDLDKNGDLDMVLQMQFPNSTRLFYREGDSYVMSAQVFGIGNEQPLFYDLDGDLVEEMLIVSDNRVEVWDNGLSGLPLDFDGTSGDDVFTGSVGADRAIGGDGDDSQAGGYGNDLVYGQDGNDTIAGGFGSDDLRGQNGDDVITGSALSDLVYGGAGDDFVNGGFGYDRINGGTGADRFYHLGIFDHGSDWIQDYTAAEGDVLQFGDASASRDDFQVNFDHTASPEGERSGDDDVAEGFVIYRPSGQIIWALVDGAGQDQINLKIGGEVFDLLG